MNINFLTLFLSEFFYRYKETAIKNAPNLINAAIILVGFFIAAKIVSRVIAYTIPRVKADPGIVLLLSRVCYYSILTFGLITALSTAGLEVQALITGLGLTGFALGFALKDILANLLSGIMLLMYRPFNIGDQIIMATYEGTIENIRMRDTLLRSYDGRLVIIPNTKLITEVVINNISARLIRESIMVNIENERYVEIAREIILRTMDAIQAIKGKVEPSIAVKKIEETAAQLEIWFWYDPRQIDKVSIKNEIAQSIKMALEASGFKSEILPTGNPSQYKSGIIHKASEGSQGGYSEEQQSSEPSS